jgi:hypothetical protein
MLIPVYPNLTGTVAMRDITQEYSDLYLPNAEDQNGAEERFTDRHPNSPTALLRVHGKQKLRRRDRLWAHWPEALSLILLAMTATQLPVVLRLWRPPLVPHLLGEMNGLVPECKR